MVKTRRMTWHDSGSLVWCQEVLFVSWEAAVTAVQGDTTAAARVVDRG
jgi:hypothetical protein